VSLTTGPIPEIEGDSVKDEVVLSLPPEARRLDTVPISEHVYRAIRDAICEGKYAPYTRLVQNQIAEQLQVSRTPVRDAMLRLSQEGLIDSVGARGYVVRKLTPRDILEVYEVRLTLEVTASDLALGQLTAANFDQIRRLQEQIARPEAHPSDYFELNRQFHEALIAPCTNTLLKNLIGEIWNLPISRLIFRQYVSSWASIEKMVEEHQEILDVAASGDRDRYLFLVAEHMRNAKEDTYAWLESGHPFEATSEA
jgi:DNA-binding GntR family transcriptional regulator